jgi:iron complex outermembrane receptor protein
MKQLKRKTLYGALVQVLGTGVALSVIATGAAAQQTQKVEKIEVTGSNIKRLDMETVAPVEIITRDQIERTGLPTVAEVIRNVPAAMSGSFNESFSNSFAPGASGVSLRGLGQKTTLVLINGRRTAGYGFAQNLQDTFVDLNSIPTSAVERIEILKDGASAIYGSDAIAGVVNIILRKDFKGLELNVSGGYAEGDWDTRLSGTWGMGDLAKDRWNVFGVVDYYKRDELLQADTKFLHTRDMRGYEGGRNFQSLTGGGTWRQLNAASTALTANHRAISECAGQVIDGPEAVRRGLIGAPAGNTTFNIPGNTFCSVDFKGQFSALPGTERVGFMGRGTKVFSDNLTGYVDVGYSQVKTDQTFQAASFVTTAPAADQRRPASVRLHRELRPGLRRQPVQLERPLRRRPERHRHAQPGNHVRHVPHPRRPDLHGRLLGLRQRHQLLEERDRPASVRVASRSRACPRPSGSRPASSRRSRSRATRRTTSTVPRRTRRPSVTRSRWSRCASRSRS